MSLFRIKIIKIKIIIKILIIIFTGTCRWIEPFFTPLMYVFIDVKKKNQCGIKKVTFTKRLKSVLYVYWCYKFIINFSECTI